MLHANPITDLNSVGRHTRREFGGGVPRCVAQASAQLCQCSQARTSHSPPPPPEGVRQSWSPKRTNTFVRAGRSSSKVPSHGAFLTEGSVLWTHSSGPRPLSTCASSALAEISALCAAPQVGRQVVGGVTCASAGPASRAPCGRKSRRRGGLCHVQAGDAACCHQGGMSVGAFLCRPVENGAGKAETRPGARV